MSSPHRLFLASAGTGKTYRLATHFAALLLDGVDPARVLATTFTRKAAGEILDRVLARIVEAASAGAPEPARASALARLATLARSIGRFQVRTLDSFFVQVARLFAYELALMPEWHIADDVEGDEQRAEVLAEVIADLGPDARLALLQAIAQVGAPTASHSSLVATVAAALTLHREAAPGAWDSCEPSPPPEDGEFEAAARIVATFDLPRTKKPDPDNPGRLLPHKTWEQFQSNAVLALERRAWKAWFELTLTKNVRAGNPTFSRVPVPDDLAEAVRVIDRQALAEFTQDLCAANRATGLLCDLYAARERAVKDRTGAYRFDDFPRALSEGPGGAPDEESRALWRADLGYRLDARISHLLLDEFQDTAPLQWRLLLPLVEELLAAGDDGDGPRTFFCVGDVKQSIYGWREAEPRLLGELHLRHPVLVPEALTESWRSSEVVLGTVNRMFAGLAERALFAGDERAALRERAEEWAGGFAPHRRAEAAGPCAGSATLWEAQPRDGETHDGACIALAVERVAALAARVPEATVAILVRAKAQIPSLLYQLRERGVDASGEGGNALTDAPLVTQALALLHLADHPDDGVAGLAVAHAPFAARYGLAGLRPDDPKARAAFRGVARRVRRELVEGGYGAFFEGLHRGCAAAASDWDRARFAQLVELALAYDARAGLRPTAFAAFVRRQRVESPTGARIKVMTVHASKGLEFDAVILPELAKSLTGQRAALLAHKEGPLEPTTRLTRAPLKSVLALRPDLQSLAEETNARALIDELSVLYVAATRAIHHLELIVPRQAASDPGSVSLRPAELLREAFTGVTWSPPSAPPLDGSLGALELWRHPDSDDTWRPAPPKVDQAAPRPALAARPLELMASPRPRLAPYRTPSGAEARPSDAASLLAPPDARARELGTLVHELFEGVVWSEDEARDDETLRGALRRSSSDLALVDAAVARFRAALAHDAVRAALSRAACDVDPSAGEVVEVLAERTFDVELGEPDAPEAWRGAIDRLALVRRGGEVVRAEVLDFKTDAVAEPALAERVEHYRPQLEAYRKVVANLYELDPAAVRASLLFVSLGARVEV